MEGKTHLIGGIAAGAFYLTTLGSVNNEAFFIASCAFGALIPDIDHTGSTIGRKVPMIDNIISAVFGHRSFTHSLLFLILAFLLFGRVDWPASIEIGLWIGMISHMLLDM